MAKEKIRDYEVRVRKNSKMFRNTLVEYDERYAFDPDSKEEVYLKEFVAENKNNLVENYKTIKGLLTGKQIREIRGKYEMTQKEYAFALGFGEVTVHRLEKGGIQTFADDEIMRLSTDPDDMYKLLCSNRDNFSENNFIRLLNIVKKHQKTKRNRIAHYEPSDFAGIQLVTSPVVDIARYMAKKYNHQYDWLEVERDLISPAKLQIMLYFVQGLSLHIFNREAFSDEIIKGRQGPVIEAVAREFPGSRVDVNDEVYLTYGMHRLVDMVVESYGQLELLVLICLCLEETPFGRTAENGIIEKQIIKEYFDEIYG